MRGSDVTRCALGCAWLIFSSCQPQGARPALQAPPRAAAPRPALPKTPLEVGSSAFAALPRLEFNQRAVLHQVPLFWRKDDNGDGALQPEELAVTWSHEPLSRADLSDARGHFSASFAALYEQLRVQSEPSGLSPEEQKRRAAVRLELMQGRPTLVASDFSSAPEAEKKLARRLQRVAVLIERLYARQKGSFGLEQRLVPGDTASAALFFRNQGSACVAAKTENDPDCHALPQPTRPVFGLYPQEIQQNPKFCEALAQRPNARALLGHFSVVRTDAAGSLQAVSYSQAYPEETAEIQSELNAAATELGAEEAALRAYLKAAAQSFTNDDWEPANQAWVAMGTHNSKYYLRVGPDEVYYEPCAVKAGYALAFARINPDSVAWRQRLEPIKQDLENDLARLAGKPYQARSVAFKLPDFIDVVLNAGDNRAPLGATVGQSLPNWGAVAEQGGRTVTMTNLYTDEDSQSASLAQMSALYCPASMALADPKPSLLGTVLHEAAHNLGPAHDYRVAGKVDSTVFGGPLASTLEELKAQSAALYFTELLVQRGLITQREADIAHLQDVAWAFGHIGQGMYDAQGKPKNYSQLAAIQLGSLQERGALEWKPAELAANGSDSGCFEVHFPAWNAAASELTRQVLQIKSRGDRARAEALKKRWVDDEGAFQALRATIAARWLRSPKASFVYALSGL